MDIPDIELTERKLLLKKYAKQITTARAVSFVLLGALAVGFNTGFTWELVTSEYMILLLLLVIAGYSYKRPFYCLFFLTTLCCMATAVCIYFVIMLFYWALNGARDSNRDLHDLMPFLLLGGVIQISSIYFLVRGTVAARKYEKLNVLIRN